MNWEFRAEYITIKHAVSVEMVAEALNDPTALVFRPDPASKSKESVRILAYNKVIERLLTIIAVEKGDSLFGANAWQSNATDIKKYKEINNE